MSGAEIQNFKTEIIGNESMDLCFLFYNLAMMVGGRAYVVLSAERRQSSFPGISCLISTVST